MNAIHAETVGGDPENCFSEKEDSVFEPFFCRHHPYKKIFYIRKRLSGQAHECHVGVYLRKVQSFQQVIKQKKARDPEPQ